LRSLYDYSLPPLPRCSRHVATRLAGCGRSVGFALRGVLLVFYTSWESQAGAIYRRGALLYLCAVLRPWLRTWLVGWLVSYHNHHHRSLSRVQHLLVRRSYHPVFSECLSWLVGWLVDRVPSLWSLSTNSCLHFRHWLRSPGASYGTCTTWALLAWGGMGEVKETQ